MHRLSQVHFTSWTPEGIQATLSKRRALSMSMLSSTTTWVTLVQSELSVCPPFCWICLWNIWDLAFPIPAGRMYTVIPLNVFPRTEDRNALPLYFFQTLFWCCQYFLSLVTGFVYHFHAISSYLFAVTLSHTETCTQKQYQPVMSHSSDFFFTGGASFPGNTLARLTLGKAFRIPWRGSILCLEGGCRWPVTRSRTVTLKHNYKSGTQAIHNIPILTVLGEYVVGSQWKIDWIVY